MPGAVDLTGAQVTDQKLVAAKDIQWQKTVVVVITVKETAFLIPVYPVIGGIKIQNQLFGCFFE